MTTTMTKDEALVQMTLRWLEAEARLQQAEARLQQGVPVEAVQHVRDEVVQRTSLDLRGTTDRLFAELIGKSGMTNVKEKP
jgi:hypothetical protein